MSLLFCDGFDHYTAAQIVKKYTTITGSVTMNTGRFGSGQCITGNSSCILTKGCAENDVIIMGFAFKIDAFYYSIQEIFALYESTTEQCNLSITPSGGLNLYRGAGTALTNGKSAGGVIKTGIWHYIEAKITIANSISSNSCIIKVDGNTVINVTAGQDTQSTANAYYDSIKFTLSHPSSIRSIDDLYICDDAGSVNNDFLGDIKIDTLYPSGNGTTSDFVGSDADSTDNYALVDEALADTSDYVESATPDDVDTYAFGDFASSPASIKAVQTVAMAKKTDASARSYCDVCRSGSTDYAGTAQSLGTDDLFYTQVREVDPDTSAAWDESGLEAAEFGIKVAV